MNTKHTPGPWRIERREGMARQMYGDSIAASHYSKPGVTDGRDVICDGVKGPDMDANAALIAAAPELLAALRDLCAACNRFAALPENWPEYQFALIMIAEAEGRE